MRKNLLLSLLLCLVFASLASASIGKYQVFSEKKGPLGLGPKSVIMLDTETGKSWEWVEGAWKPIPQFEEKKGPSPEEVKAQQDAELNALKAKQDEELLSIKAKQEEEIKSLKAKLTEKPVITTVKVESAPRKVSTVSRKKRATAQAETAVNEDAGEKPGWLEE
jgi:ElaB/YqjD/DUF883 family membrane-anchored ribosome-binding protein